MIANVLDVLELKLFNLMNEKKKKKRMWFSSPPMKK